MVSFNVPHVKKITIESIVAILYRRSHIYNIHSLLQEVGGFGYVPKELRDCLLRLESDYRAAAPKVWAFKFL